MCKIKILASISILVAMSNTLYSEVFSYKPYPIVYIHGFHGDPSNWGVKEGRWTIYESNIHDPDSTDIDSLTIPTNKPHTIYSFKENYFERPGSEHSWYDTLYSGIRYSAGLEPPESSNLKHIYQEVIAMVPNNGSLDPDGSDIGQGAKVWHKVEQTLREYYGPNWQSNPDAKVVLVCHSAGGLAARQVIYQFGDNIKPHIAKVITLGTPHKGVDFAAFWNLQGHSFGTCSIISFAGSPMLIAINKEEVCKKF